MPSASRPAAITATTKTGWCGGPEVATVRYSGKSKPAPLQPFLQPALRRRPRPVLGFQQRREGAAQEGPRRVQPAVEVERAEHRFQRIGQNVAPRGQPRLALARRHHQRRAEVERFRDPGQGVPGDQHAEARLPSVALALLREALDQPFRHQQAEHAVADELQPLVGVELAAAGIGGGAVRQRLEQQFRPGEAVADARLESVEIRRRRRLVRLPAASSPSRRR